MRKSMSGSIYTMVLTLSLTQGFHELEPGKRKDILDSVDTSISGTANGLIHLKRYRTLRAESDLMIWTASEDPDTLFSVKERLSVGYGAYLNPVNLFVSLYEHSPYLNKGVTLRDTLNMEPLKYFVAYPMSKTPEWYLIPFEERKKIMADHIGMAASHPESRGIRSFTTYSYGLGDQEFVVMYETDSLTAWSHVTGKLREAEARKWIVQETPIIVGRYIDHLADILLPD